MIEPQTDPDAAELATLIRLAIPGPANLFRVLNVSVWSSAQSRFPRKVLSFQTDKGDRMYLLSNRRGAQISVAISQWQSEEGIIADTGLAAFLVLLWKERERPVEAEALGQCFDVGRYSACLIPFKGG